MAEARFVENDWYDVGSSEEGGERASRLIEAELPEYSADVPWSGDRAWRGFDRTARTYEWKTSYDVAVAIARAALGGKRPAGEAVDAIEDEVMDAFASWQGAFPEESEGLEDEAEIERRFLEHVSGGFGYGSAYAEDGDLHLLEAARALDLPSWAELRIVEGGGPGSGYEQGLVVLRAGRTFDDLADWLEAHDEGAG